MTSQKRYFSKKKKKALTTLQIKLKFTEVKNYWPLETLNSAENSIVQQTAQVGKIVSYLLHFNFCISQHTLFSEKEIWSDYLEIQTAHYDV